MKKILGLIAAVIVLDAILGVGVVRMGWRPFLHFASTVEVRAGERLARRHDYVAAIGRYDGALRWDPHNVKAYAARSHAWTYLGRYDAAIDDGDRAVQIDPKSGDGYGARGWAREWKGDEEGAQADFDRAIALSPGVAAFYSHRGYVRGRQKEWDGALQDLDQALKIDPQMASGYHDRAWVKLNRGDAAGALDDENAAVEFRPHVAAYYLRRAELHLRLNDADSALTDAKAALDIDPHSLEGLYWQAVSQRRLGNVQDSISSLNQALQINPGFSDGFFERGISKYVAGDTAGAEMDLKASRGNNLDRPYAELWLWILAVQQGARENADRVLGDYLTDARTLRDGTSPEKLGDLLLGRVTPDALANSLDLAQSAAKQKDELCQVWFFAGKVALLGGDRATARADFQKAVAAGAFDIVEGSEAKRELAKL
jgi:tetratricopeptide (TPR) repeat protein